jgi:LmbE family N-acetylglucosaminyl deacetylase
MERRGFLTGLASATLGEKLSPEGQANSSQISNPSPAIERRSEGKPHAGKALALVTPHLDDGRMFAGGTLIKLLQEGYTGYFIRTSNDEKDSYKRSLGETVLANEQDSKSFVRIAGLRQMFDLSYRNHRMDEISRTEIRSRLVFLFRLLKIDTVLSYDPWGHYEENPDHYVTAQAVEAACWMAGENLDHPEHFTAGLKPHSVSEKYYFARGPQFVNRMVDITSTIERKMACILACQTMIEHMIKDLNDSLASRQLRIPAFTDHEQQAPNAFIQASFQTRDQQVGSKYGLSYAEEFHHIGPDRSLEAYIQQNAVPL